MSKTMAKSTKQLEQKGRMKVAPDSAMVVCDAKTGASVTVKGVGALKGDSLKIRKGVNLLKPIAEQALSRRSERHTTNNGQTEKRKAG